MVKPKRDKTIVTNAPSEVFFMRSSRLIFCDAFCFRCSEFNLLEKLLTKLKRSPIKIERTNEIASLISFNDSILYSIIIAITKGTIRFFVSLFNFQSESTLKNILT